MRKPTSSIQRLLMAVLALVLTLGVARVAAADDRSDARTHYQAGQRAYAAADYKTAIREFSAAQQLVPADLNSYNLALCYDKLGDADSAIQYYREYLSKVPNTDKRAEIEASVARLDAAAKSAAAKRADEDRRADEAKRADDQRRADEAKRAEDQRRIDEARRAPEPPPAMGGNNGVPPVTGVGPSVGATVGPGVAPAPSGDAQLNSVQSIDINAIRNQRGAGAQIDIHATGGPAPAPTAVGVNGAPPPAPGAPLAANGAQPMPNPAAPAVEVEVPVYKKWWFWAVVGVSLYVVYEIATENSNNNEATGREAPMFARGHNAAMPQQPQGLTLLRW